MNNSLKALIDGLKLAIKSATPGQWSFARSGANVNVQAPVNLQRGGAARAVLCGLKSSQWRNQLATAHDAAFIALANPENIAVLIAALEQAQADCDRFKFAFNEWLEKTEWIQKECSSARVGFPILGMHRADVMTRYIAQLEARQLTVRLPKGEMLGMVRVMPVSTAIEAIRAAGGSVVSV